MKRTLCLAIATVAVFCLGIGSVQAVEPPICIKSVCGPDDLYSTECCLQWVKVNPNCNGPRCKMVEEWVCWQEPCYRMFLGSLPVLLPVPSMPDFTPVNLQQSPVD